MTVQSVSSRADALTQAASRGLRSSSESGQRASAVVYLRVSTKEQAEMGGQAEGFSIPAQREACRRKAASLDADVVAEFVDRGESARSAKRPELQGLLRFVKSHPVDFVIVHKVDRLARNRFDDAEINLALRLAGAQLVSVSEAIDETPSGTLLHGIMSTIAEFYSSNLSHEIKTKTLKKVQAGGTPSLAPIGYLNVRRVIDGREVRTVELDPERAGHIKWAFEAYAGGDYTLSSLADELERRGLTQRPTKERPVRPLTVSRLQQVLTRRYYIGVVVYGGLEYEGSHPPLVSGELFERVQQRLAANRQAGDRSYKRQHYLKGSLRCGRCKSRMLFFISKGRGGSYEYFRCSGRHGGRTTCDLPHLPAALVEAEVERQWAGEQLSVELASELERRLLAHVSRHVERSAEERRRLETKIAQLKRERYRWAEKAMAEVVPDDIAREKQTELGRQLGWAEEELHGYAVAAADLRQLIPTILGLATKCHQAYLASTPDERRLWNQAWWSYIEVDEEDDASIVATFERTSIADAVSRDGGTVAAAAVAEAERQRTTARPLVGSSNIVTLVDQSGRRSNRTDREADGSNLRLLVEVMGIEPTASSMRPKRSSQLSYTPVREARGYRLDVTPSTRGRLAAGTARRSS
jgi:site-specific DNA recombinase